MLIFLTSICRPSFLFLETLLQMVAEVIHGYNTIDNVRVAIEIALPHVIANHHDIFSTFKVIFRHKTASQQWVNAGEAEYIVAYVTGIILSQPFVRATNKGRAFLIKTHIGK